MKALIRILPLALLSLAFVSCEKSGDQRSETQINILLDWKAEPTYAGFYLARELGYFEDLEKQGYSIEIVEGNGASTTAQIVGSSNEFMLASCTGTATAVAVSKDVPIKSLAVFYPRIPTVLYSRGDTPIRTPSEMIGRRIGLIEGSTTVHEYRALAILNDIDRSKVIEKSVGWDVAPLLTNKVDGLMNYAELTPIELRIQGYEVATMRFSDFGVHLLGLNLIANENHLRENQEQLDTLVSGVVKGYAFLRDNPADAAKVFSRLFPEKDHQYVSESMIMVAELLGHGSIGEQTERDWAASLKILKTLGLLDKDIPVSATMTRNFYTANPNQ